MCANYLCMWNLSPRLCIMIVPFLLIPSHEGMEKVKEKLFQTTPQQWDTVGLLAYPAYDYDGRSWLLRKGLHCFSFILRLLRTCCHNKIHGNSLWPGCVNSSFRTRMTSFLFDACLLHNKEKRFFMHSLLIHKLTRQNYHILSLFAMWGWHRNVNRISDNLNHS